MAEANTGIAKLRAFLREMSSLVESTPNETDLLERGAKALGRLVAEDDWLPEECTVANPATYRQYLLFCDPQERFSVVSFVWGPGQKTPIHDHTVWGLVGVLRGAENDRNFRQEKDGLIPGEMVRLTPGTVVKLSPRDGDIHQVSNAHEDRASISIHVYGGNIGKVARHVFDPATGTTKAFVSGYNNPAVPNFWA